MVHCLMGNIYDYRITEHLSKKNVICSKHFSEEDLCREGKRIHLGPNAVPKLYWRRNDNILQQGRQRRNHDKKVTYIEQNNEDGTDFDSYDSVNDPNYEDEAQKERLLVQAEKDGSDIDNDELEANDDAPSNPFNSTKQSSEPKKYSETVFSEICGPNINNNKSALPLKLLEKTLGMDTLGLMVYESNLYATQNGKNLDLHLDELRAFIGILIIMGFHRQA
ncbi:hypothetical protein JTB14_007702 [Gonioctena quinquepunctata]|nr:hypothetical protein JTB14_007702 [Gonioctena quinquepunctata]